MLSHLFYPLEREPSTVQVEIFLSQHCVPQTYAQRTKEWFTLRQFHVSAMMASKIVTNTSAREDVDILQMLSDSWFSRVRSTSEMVAGTKNEPA
jgi:hypothetical protein